MGSQGKKKKKKKKKKMWFEKLKFKI